ncbi:MAG: Npt1/Npt2 family nucleotide transporter [Rickettsiaceae bacterium]
MPNTIESHHFTKFKQIFWPIHDHEKRRFLLISFLMFCTLFNQNILRILKDSVLISEVSVEIISFTKVYCVTPLAALFVIIYANMLNHLSFERIYYILISVFVGVFLIFAFIIYPNIDYFHMDQLTLDQLMYDHPHWKWYIALIGNWSYAIFYTFSELWPNIFYVLLFWQFANSLTTTEEAKRFYTLFSLFGNSSLIVVGLLMMILPSCNDKIVLIQISVLLVTIAAFISCIMIKTITSSHSNNTIRAKHPSKKHKMSILESFRFIARSRYLWLMLICSASFGLAMNLVESVWKSKIKELYSTLNTYAQFHGEYILWTGVVIMIMTIIGNNIMRRYGWLVSAIISPMIIMITGIIFFVLIVFDDTIAESFDYFIVISPLALSVFIGAIQNILAKGTKYSMWDTSREMLYIPLDEELKTKGKASVDVISSKIGKSCSGIIYSVIFTIAPAATFGSISSILMFIFIAVCVLWIDAIKKIFVEYKKIV